MTLEDWPLALVCVMLFFPGAFIHLGALIELIAAVIKDEFYLTDS